jgi:hypothetical protein
MVATEAALLVNVAVLIKMFLRFDFIFEKILLDYFILAPTWAMAVMPD